MLEVHVVVKQESAPNATLSVGSTIPKLSPVTVTEVPPDCGVFSVVTTDKTAESNEKTGRPVPATPPTLTADSPNIVLIELLPHTTVVADVHDDVPHAAVSTVLVADNSQAPKLSPETVKELPPLEALLRPMSEATAASKLYPTTCVPTTPPTLTLDVCAAAVAALDTHPKLVADVHVDVKHTSSDSDTLALVSHTPKLSPATVTELPPLEAELSCPYDATAASKLCTALAVPATPPTLTADTPYVVLTPLLKHPSVVADVHADVLHTTISSAPVALRSTEPKLSPTTVTELPPLTAEFCSQPDPTAASKLYPTTCVPTTPPTLTLDVCAAAVAALDAHPKLVADVHVDVLHAPSDSDTLALVSHTPKLSPATVTELPPLEAELSCPYDATAASKLYTALAVPATPPTLTADTPYIVLA